MTLKQQSSGAGVDFNDHGVGRPSRLLVSTDRAGLVATSGRQLGLSVPQRNKTLDKLALLGAEVTDAVGFRQPVGRDQ